MISKKNTFLSSEFFERISPVMSEGVFFIDRKGKILKINPAFTTILGYGQKDILGKTFAGLRHDLSLSDDTRKRRLDKFGLYFFHLSEKNSMPMIMRHRQGHPVRVLLRSVIVRDAEGELIEALGILEKEAVAVDEKVFESAEALNKRIWETEQNFKGILDNSGDAILIADFNTRIVTVNNALLQLLLLQSADELVGKHLVDVGPFEGTFTCTTGEEITLDEKYQKEQIALTNELFASGKAYGELYLFRKDKKVVPVEVTLSLLKNKSQERRGTISIFRDITQRKLTEKRLLNVQQELEEKVKERTVSLEEANAAMRVLLKKREEDKNELEEKILFNLEELVHPHLDKLKHSQLSERQETYVEIMEKHLKEVSTSLSQRLATLYRKLTPMEIQVANLVQQGKTSKEIAGVLHLSAKTIESHRKNIRTKIGLTNQKANLRSYLLTIQNR